jgi:hypothetical protein
MPNPIIMRLPTSPVTCRNLGDKCLCASAPTVASSVCHDNDARKAPRTKSILSTGVKLAPMFSPRISAAK